MKIFSKVFCVICIVAMFFSSVSCLAKGKTKCEYESYPIDYVPISETEHKVYWETWEYPIVDGQRSSGRPLFDGDNTSIEEHEFEDDVCVYCGYVAGTEVESWPKDVEGFSSEAHIVSGTGSDEDRSSGADYEYSGFEDTTFGENEDESEFSNLDVIGQIRSTDDLKDALEKIFTVPVAIVTIDVKMLDELDRFIENLTAEGSSIENGLENSVENSPLKSVIFDKYSGFALTKNVFVEEVLARMLKASSDGCYVSIAGVNDEVVDKLLSLISKGASRNEFMNWLSNFETKSVDNVDCYCVDFVFCDNHSVLTIEQYVFAVDDGRLVDVLPVNS